MNELVTGRLRLRPVGVLEARCVLAGVPGPASTWAPGYPTTGDIISVGGYLEYWAAIGDPRLFGPYQLVRAEDGLVIGGAGFHGPPDHDGEVEVGYGVIPAARRHGYATEALRALLTFAQAHGVTAVRGAADRANQASHRVMIGAGMTFLAEDHDHQHYEVRYPAR